MGKAFERRSAPELPVLVFDALRMREIAINIWHAQKAGWPSTLTFVLEKDKIIRRQERAFNRRSALNQVPTLLSRDEYPFACTMEHAGSAWIGHVPPEQNSKQGGIIAEFFRKHGALAGYVNSTDGFKFRVKVINL